jgi:hypothetical protein
VKRRQQRNPRTQTVAEVMNDEIVADNSGAELMNDEIVTDNPRSEVVNGELVAANFEAEVSDGEIVPDSGGLAAFSAGFAVYRLGITAM